MSAMTSFRLILEAEQGESRLVVRRAMVAEEMNLGDMAEAFAEFAPVAIHFTDIASEVHQRHKARLAAEFEHEGGWNDHP